MAIRNLRKPESKAVTTMQSKQHLLFLLLLLATLFTAKAASQPLSNCTRNCGSLKIPYPFGTTEGCYLDSSFLINCTQTSSRTPPTPFLGRNNISVLNISLDGELLISQPVVSDCYNGRGKLTSGFVPHVLNLASFYFSSTRNKLTAVGCDTLGLVVGWGLQRNYTVGCVSLCSRLSDIVANGSCSGTGCCDTSIPQGLSEVSYISGTVYNHTRVHDFNPCGYAFLVEEGAYNFSSTDVVSFPKKGFPVVLDWAVGNHTCEEAQRDLSSYACKAENSYCYNSTNGLGYRCRCSDGFQGNPYLLDGCKGILFHVSSRDILYVL